MFTNFEKDKIGRTFQYYRKKQNIKWKVINQDSFISKNIYVRMSKGKIYEDDSHYCEFLYFFNLEFKRKERFEEWLKEYLLRLDTALECYELDEIKDLYNEFQKELAGYKECPIYEQYYICFNYIFNYYLENKYISEEEMYVAISLIQFGIFEEILSVYLLEIMYISNNNNIGNDSLRRNLAKFMDQFNHPILYQLKANNEKCEKKLQEALDIHKMQYVIWENKKNSYRLTKTLNGMFMIYRNIDIKKSKEIILELEENLKSEKIPFSLKKSISHNIGMFHYVNNCYKEAYEVFLRNVEKYNGISDMLFLGYVCTQLNLEIPDCFNFIDYRNSFYKEYIDYYKMKKNGRNTKDLVDYIMNVLLYGPLSSEEYLEPLWSIFEFEMFTILKQSKKYYNAYIEFREMRDKVVKYS